MTSPMTGKITDTRKGAESSPTFLVKKCSALETFAILAVGRIAEVASPHPKERSLTAFIGSFGPMSPQ